MDQLTLREQLEALSDPAYRDFHLKTCPQAEHLLGVRVPELRKIAKSIVKNSNYFEFLDQIQPYYYEEIMVTGIVIASAPMSFDERLNYLTWFLPMINNWAICDCFCASFKPKPSELTSYWHFLLSLQTSDAEYTLRFMYVMMLDHFMSAEYLPQIFTVLDSVQSELYYVQMAKAWLVAEILIKFYDLGLEYLTHDYLSTFVHNKSIQKACESRRLTLDQKQHLRSIKL